MVYCFELQGNSQKEFFKNRNSKGKIIMIQLKLPFFFLFSHLTNVSYSVPTHFL